jgi:predicted permease
MCWNSSMPPEILESFALILICILAGHLLTRWGQLGKAAPAVLNVYVIYLAFPALVLAQVPKLLAAVHLDWRLIVPISAAWGVFGLAIALFSTARKVLGFDLSIVGALVLTAGLGNTSFVGFPVVEALYGEKGLATAVILDQAGTFLALSTVGLICASYFSGSGVKGREIFLRVIKFPPFIALLIAVLLAWIETKSGLALASRLYTPAQKLGSSLAPVALVSVGTQLRFDLNLLRRRWRTLAFGLCYKLLVAPLVSFLVFIVALKSSEMSTRVSVLETAMGPMITGAIVAQEFGLDTELTSLMVGIGVPLSLMTLCVWYFVLEYFRSAT